MIREIATISVDPAKADDFVDAVRAAKPFFEAAEGFVSFALERVIEKPGGFRLVVGWTSVEAHMVDFRESPGFQEWRRLASPFFVEAPQVVHVETVI